MSYQKIVGIDDCPASALRMQHSLQCERLESVKQAWRVGSTLHKCQLMMSIRLESNSHRAGVSSGMQLADATGKSHVPPYNTEGVQ